MFFFKINALWYIILYDMDYVDYSNQVSYTRLLGLLFICNDTVLYIVIYFYYILKRIQVVLYSGLNITNLLVTKV